MLQILRCAVLTITATLVSVPAFAEDRIEGRVEVGGAPIAGADVTWAGDGTVDGGSTTGSDGAATGTWTLVSK